MKKYITWITTVIAILSPLLLLYLFPVKGIRELSFIDVCGYTVAVATLSILIVYIFKYISPDRIKSIVIMRDWGDREDGDLVVSELKNRGFDGLPLSIDFFITDSNSSDNRLVKLLRRSLPSIIIIGNETFKSQYIHPIIKTMKTENLEYVILLTSADVEIPNYLQKGKIIGTIDQLKDPQFKGNLIKILKNA